jgi:transposase
MCNGIEVLPWLASNPDMNPIEHAWGELEHRVQHRDPHPTNIGQLWVALQEEWVALQEEWENLQFSFRKELYESMPR